MQKNPVRNTVVTTALIMILLVIVWGIVKNIYKYYSGPDYAVSCYIKELNQKDYNRVYQLLSPESIQSIGTKDEITAYYKKIYEEENKLMEIKQMGYAGNQYVVQYRYLRTAEKGTLTVERVKGKWYIRFPFEEGEVEVFAPYGANVYLDSRKMQYSEDECYKLSHVLPGNYMLKVDVDKEGYKDYYKILHIPEECNFITPYELAHVTVVTPAGFKVKLDQFVKSSAKAKIEFDDLLLGSYNLEVEDLNGDFKPQSFSVNVKQGENTFNLEALELSDQGEEKLKTLLSQFYEHYLSAIETHNAEELSPFLVGKKSREQKDLFSSWYIDKKNITQADMKSKLESVAVSGSGLIHAEVTEIVELTNKEYDDEMNEVEREYKVIITWDNMVMPLNGIWKIMDREIKESVVAVKDQQGRWVQY